jgi:hypothetical protein
MVTKKKDEETLDDAPSPAVSDQPVAAVAPAVVNVPSGGEGDLSVTREGPETFASPTSCRPTNCQLKQTGTWGGKYPLFTCSRCNLSTVDDGEARRRNPALAQAA